MNTRCESCKKIAPIRTRGLCKRCYEQDNNRKRIEETKDNFKPASQYNKKVFDIYIQKILSSYIKNSEPKVAIRFKELLEVENIPEIKNLDDIYRLSDKYQIYYNSSKGKKHGCPFHRIRYQLIDRPKRGSYYSDRSIEKLKDIFKPSDLKIINLFLIGKARTTKASQARLIRCISSFYAWNKKDSLIHSQSNISEYLKSLDHLSVAHYSDYYGALRSFYGWMAQTEYIEQNPFNNLSSKSEERKCLKCKKIKKFKSSKLICSQCNAESKNITIIAKLSKTRFRGQYKQNLWNLYLQYINRYVIKKHHQEVSLLFATYLNENQTLTIQNWKQVNDLSINFSLFVGKEFKGGCPFEKVAKMMQELGVLPPRDEDYTVYYHNAISRIDPDFRDITQSYFDSLLKSKRTLRTCCSLCNLFLKLQHWSSSKDLSLNPLLLSRAEIIEFIEENNSVETISSLSKFFRWAKDRGHINGNPLNDYKLPKNHKELLICSDEQINQLFKYVKSKKSDPERALIIALILYWGLTARELRFSTIEISDGLINIQLFRGSLSYRNKQHRREQILKLPGSPKWLKDLQSRFIDQWAPKYGLIKKSFPKQLLLFSNNLKSNRPIGDEALRIRIYKATQEATGGFIPLSVIRRTSGHIYSMRGEASILTTLGWSRDYATDFIWRQRKLHSPQNKKLKIQSKVEKLK